MTGFDAAEMSNEFFDMDEVELKLLYENHRNDRTVERFLYRLGGRTRGCDVQLWLNGRRKSEVCDKEKSEGYRTGLAGKISPPS
jgi:hypothetical protein